VTIPVGTRFSVPVQTGPDTTQLPVQWVPGSFSGIKRSERGGDHPFPSNVGLRMVWNLPLLCASMGMSWGDTDLLLTRDTKLVRF
jgi:hypothetical protein